MGNQVSPTSGHQPTGAVGRLVSPDGQATEQISEPDREIEQGRTGRAAMADGQVGGLTEDGGGGPRAGRW